MNSFKPLITIAVLGGIGYFVYTHLNSKPSTPPPGAPASWDAAPLVQMPGDEPVGAKWGGPGSGSGSFLPQTSIGGNSDSAPPTGISSAGSSLNSAPNFGAPEKPIASQYTATANYDDAPAAGSSTAGPTQEKWGTTDPAAAVTNSPPPNISYGEPPASGDNRSGDAYPVNNNEPSPPAYGAAGNSPEVAYGTSDSQDFGRQFEAVWEKGNRLLEDGKLVEGLTELSAWHEHPKLSATENQRLTSLLDQVAGSVIYSIQHQLESAHVVKENERLEDIGEQYNVPWQLIAKINGIDDPSSLRPGEELKVVRGPFNAVIQIEKRQLTLMLGKMYAGRFVIGLGRDMPLHEGVFAVTEKTLNPVYHGHGRTIAADDANNPLGERWIAIGSDMAIHGVGPLTDVGSSNQPGSASLGTRDVEDVYDILSVGSKVMIVR